MFGRAGHPLEDLGSPGEQCTATDPGGLKTATTTNDTVALRADCFGAGDGQDQSFTANVIVSTTDIA
ncbi:MAG TPA: hypothetical protein VG244_13485, partial [Acidimicrobiales bacterium]|nr:hypothetical protein [Acidimicrobiales bacterium]